jgi:hypothetical protein
MNKEQLDKMTPEEKQIAIGQICGWTPEVRKMYGGEKNVKGWGFNAHLDLGDRDRRFTTNPSSFTDYLNSLDAMAEARKSIPHDKWPAFSKTVCELSIGQPVTTERLNFFEAFMTLDSSSEVQADAFLLVMLP